MCNCSRPPDQDLLRSPSVRQCIWRSVKVLVAGPACSKGGQVDATRAGSATSAICMPRRGEQTVAARSIQVPPLQPALQGPNPRPVPLLAQATPTSTAGAATSATATMLPTTMATATATAMNLAASAAIALRPLQ
mmetsp:Transcript_79850/g.166001  ORF Transcript_79850/g.166001 Transcript_79850/m.166001 type:complete len:135 (-) Transcript_79850:562-966(-)